MRIMHGHQRFSLTGLRVFREVAEQGTFRRRPGAGLHTVGGVPTGRRDRGRAGRRCSTAARRSHLTPPGTRVVAPSDRVVDESTPPARGGRSQSRGRAGTARRVPQRRSGPGAEGPGDAAARARGRMPRGHHPGADAGPAGRHPRPRAPRPAPPFRPPDAESPPLSSRRSPNASWSSACPRPTRSPAATPSTCELRGQAWVASGPTPARPYGGVAGAQPEARTSATPSDWLAKLQLVAAGLAITTLAPIALDVLTLRHQGRRCAWRAAGDTARRARPPPRITRRRHHPGRRRPDRRRPRVSRARPHGTVVW